MNEIFTEIGNTGIVPVVNIDCAEKGVPLAGALLAGGIPCVEVAFRTAAAEEALRCIAEGVPEILAGAGTVLSAEQAERAAGAGAKFIVSPGFNPRTAEFCLKKGIPFIPGCSNASDMELALDMGLEVVKFFPAEQSGGPDFLKAVSGPFPTLKFIPTGGINGENLPGYLALDNVLACGGTWLTRRDGTDLISAGEFGEITALCREAAGSVPGFSFVHLGINTDSKEEAEKAAKRFQFLFNFGLRETDVSFFASGGLELMNSHASGKHGHIAIAVNSIPRAAAYLEKRGIELDYGNVRRDAGGNIQLVYLKEEIAGFAIHLSKRA